MKDENSGKLPALPNLLSDLPPDLPDELIDPLVSLPHLRIERIVSLGHTAPETGWYDQEEDEWVLVVQGEGKLEFEGDANIRHMRAGDHLLIPAHCRHRVIWTLPGKHTVWLAIFFSNTVIACQK